VCWEGDNTVSLPDLRTEDSDVLSTFESWITDLVSNYSVDGLRVDSAEEVDQAFFPPFQSAGTFPYKSTVVHTDLLKLEFTLWERSIMVTLLLSALISSI
jgi:hypothetical protein